MQLIFGMLGSLTESVNILCECHEFRLLTREFCKRIMCWVRIDAQRHMSSIRIKLPDKAWVCCKRFGCREILRRMRSPKTASSSEGWQSRRSRKASSTDSHNPSRFLEVLLEVCHLIQPFRCAFGGRYWPGFFAAHDAKTSDRKEV